MPVNFPLKPSPSLLAQTEFLTLSFEKSQQEKCLYKTTVSCSMEHAKLSILQFYL